MVSDMGCYSFTVGGRVVVVGPIAAKTAARLWVAWVQSLGRAAHWPLAMFCWAVLGHCTTYNCCTLPYKKNDNSWSIFVYTCNDYNWTQLLLVSCMILMYKARYETLTWKISLVVTLLNTNKIALLKSAALDPENGRVPRLRQLE